MEEAVERHYCESVFLAKYLPESSLSIVDIGSGGGFPGIPVAIARPDCSITLVESHQRKAVFLREATRSLTNVRVLPTRAGDVSERFDCAISRAVSYADLVPILKKIARTADLLTGVEDPPEEMFFTWNRVIALPWGTGRYLRQGVSRGRE
jgi:16S rRNA (guanine(527)-N(7))-methyltransferase RsmG